MGWKLDSGGNHAGPRNVALHSRASLSYQYALLSILYFDDNNTFHRGRTFLLSGLGIVEAPIAHMFKGRLNLSTTMSQRGYLIVVEIGDWGMMAVWTP